MTKLFEESSNQSKSLREKHTDELRPNLNHPENKTILDELNTAEAQRKESQNSSITKYRDQMILLYFEESNKFFVRVLNNISFLLIFYDNWILF